MGKLLGLPDVGTPSTSGGAYEFDQLQNHTFRDLAKAMRFVGIFTIVAGVVYGVVAILVMRSGNVLTPIIALVQGVVDFVLGGYLLNAAANCMRVADTQGADIPNLMAGLEQLRSYFRLQMILIIIAICIVSAGFVLLIATH